MSECEDEIDYREEVLKLVEEGKIKRTVKYIEKQSDESLEKMYKAYIVKELDETNERIANTLIDQTLNLLGSMGIVDDKEDLKKDLKESELFKRNLKSILSYVTPYIPLIGLACGAIYLGKHMLRRKKEEEEKK